MDIAITKVQLTPQIVGVHSLFKIEVDVKIITPEPLMFRLPFRLGTDLDVENQMINL